MNSLEFQPFFDRFDIRGIDTRDLLEIVRRLEGAFRLAILHDGLHVFRGEKSFEVFGGAFVDVHCRRETAGKVVDDGGPIRIGDVLRLKHFGYLGLPLGFCLMHADHCGRRVAEAAGVLEGLFAGGIRQGLGKRG